MALTVLRNVCIECGVIAITDLTGAYDAEDNPGGYGTPNPEITDDSYTVSVYLPGQESPALTRNLLTPLPTPDEDGHYRWEITPADLGLGPTLPDFPSAIYEVVVTQGGVEAPQWLFAYGDLEAAITKCICCSGASLENLLLPVQLNGAIELFNCGKLKECRDVIKELYRKTKACCGCGCN